MQDTTLVTDSIYMCKLTAPKDKLARRYQNVHTLHVVPSLPHCHSYIYIYILYFRTRTCKLTHIYGISDQCCVLHSSVCLLERLQCALFSSFFSRNIQKRSIACSERGTPQTR
jgi:hypothetical protein